MLNEDDVERALALQFNHPVVARGGENGVADAVVAAYSPHSESVERMRDLRTQITQIWRNSPERRILAIASPERREGRSYLAANLATLFARSGERTLLIDADMRHPYQHSLFNLSNSVGLSDLLSGHSGKDAVRRIHPQLRLFVLPAGIPPSNPQELAGGRFFDQLLGRFAKLFNVILMDTPAATETADAQILAASAGHAILVARRNHTRLVKLNSAMESLKRAGVNVIGSVINEH